jgi:hypothetical protein
VSAKRLFKTAKDEKKTSPTFVALFEDGLFTRMTTHCERGKHDLKRGIVLARIAYETYDQEISQRYLDGKKTRRTNAKNEEEGEWESEDDDDTPRGRAAAEADDSMPLSELRADHESVMRRIYADADREARSAYKTNK